MAACWAFVRKFAAAIDLGCRIWSVSSAGSEHYLDRVGVTGSNPVRFTDYPAVPVSSEAGTVFLNITINLIFGVTMHGLISFDFL